MQVLYQLGIRLYHRSIQLAAFWLPKAQKWVAGRRSWQTEFTRAWSERPHGDTLWMHVASLGEFEQGRPVLEEFRAAHPDWTIVLTFFSPSGYEVRRHYNGADYVWYLPLDTPANARCFLQLIQPRLAVFVKYDFWAHYLFELQQRRTPTLLIAGLFRPQQVFFKWYGAWWRKVLGCFATIHCQTIESQQLLQSIGIENVEWHGDPRIDRVVQLAATSPENKIVADFITQAQRVIIAGSTWEADERLIMEAAQNKALQGFKWVIAPHDPSQARLEYLEHRLTGTVRYSQFDPTRHLTCRFLIIDNVGMLNQLYRYGWVAYIGGGFGKGIHNTLEPAAFGLPVIFGPKYEKFEEAHQFVARRGAWPITNAADFLRVIQQLESPERYTQATFAVKEYLHENAGASSNAIEWLNARMNQ